jgi:hypothetical protein
MRRIKSVSNVQTQHFTMPTACQIVLLAGALLALAAANDAPVIGILTQPYSGPNASKSVRRCPKQRINSSDVRLSQATYIAASYVKYIESAGGRVVPVHFTQPLAAIGELISSSCNCSRLSAYYRAQLHCSPSLTALFFLAEART